MGEVEFADLFEKNAAGAFYLIDPNGRIRHQQSIAAFEDITDGITEKMDSQIDRLCAEFGIARNR